MIIAAPTANTRQPHYFEGSSLRSRRDSDAVTRAWAKTKSTAHRNNAINNQQFFTLQKLGRNRRRVVGGGASTGTGMIFKGEYNGGAYSTQNVVAYTPTGGSAGMYIALTSVPAGVLPDTGSPYWFAWPNSPPGMFA